MKKKKINTQQKKLSLLTRSCSLPAFTAYKTITYLTQYELSQEESSLLKVGSYSLSKQIKCKNLKFSLPLKRFVVRLSTTLNLRKLKFRLNRISHIWPILISTTTNHLHVYYVNIVCYETLKNIKISLK